METSKSRIFTSTIFEKIQLCVGIVLGIPFFFVTVYIIFTGQFLKEIPAFIFILMVDAFAVFLIINSRRTSKLLKNIPVYSAALSADPTGSTLNLAAAMNTSEDVVRDNLRRMIAKRYVTNIVLYDADGYVKFVNPAPESKTAGSDTSAKTNPPQKSLPPEETSSPSTEMFTVKCENCGATNILAQGQVGECEYCGSAIKA